MRKFRIRIGRSCAVLVAAAASLLWGACAELGGPVPDPQVDALDESTHAAHDSSSPAARSAAAASLPSGYSINGIDVSSHDHANGNTVNWANQRAAGDEFAFVKATEGTSYVNPYFDQDYHGAKDNGLYV